MTETITINGEARPWRDQDLAEVLAEYGVDPGRPGVAVALNAEIAPRGEWAGMRVRPGDAIEIVHIVRGG